MFSLPLFARRSLLQRLPSSAVGLSLRSGRSPIWHPHRATPGHRHPVLHQWSTHHLPVRRAGCQLGCLAVWQKHHVRIPNAPPGSVPAYWVGAVCAPAESPCKAVLTSLPAAWLSWRPGCTRAPAHAYDLEEQARLSLSPERPPLAPIRSAKCPANKAPSGSTRAHFNRTIARTRAPSYAAQLRARSNA